MCVQIHTVCELIHGVQNYTVVPFAYNMKKFPSLEFFYTHALSDVTDKYEVCLGALWEISEGNLQGE